LSRCATLFRPTMRGGVSKEKRKEGRGGGKSKKWEEKSFSDYAPV